MDEWNGRKMGQLNTPNYNYIRTHSYIYSIHSWIYIHTHTHIYISHIYIYICIYICKPHYFVFSFLCFPCILSRKTLEDESKIKKQVHRRTTSLATTMPGHELEDVINQRLNLYDVLELPTPWTSIPSTTICPKLNANTGPLPWNIILTNTRTIHQLYTNSTYYRPQLISSPMQTSDPITTAG